MAAPIQAIRKSSIPDNFFINRPILIKCSFQIQLSSMLPFQDYCESLKTSSLGINPLTPSGLLYLNSLDRFIFYLGGVGLVFVITMIYRNSCTKCKQYRA